MIGVSSPSRRRGAQPGNTNALKHGRYTQRCPHVVKDLLGKSFNDRQTEILFLRIFIVRLAELNRRPTSISANLALLHTLNHCVLRLTHLLRSEMTTVPDWDNLIVHLKEAIAAFPHETIRQHLEKHRS